MLKGIPNIISPELLKLLMEMGHGDRLVIADGNFPAASKARRLVRCDGHGTEPVLEAVLRLFPLDEYVASPAGVMSVVKGDDTVPVIWDSYKRIIRSHFSGFSDFEYIDRFAFYERAMESYAVAATSESALYANIILTKGVIKS